MVVKGNTAPQTVEKKESHLSLIKNENYSPALGVRPKPSKRRKSWQLSSNFAIERDWKQWAIGATFDRYMLNVQFGPYTFTKFKTV